MADFASLLIANRGEIAVRIIRTARALGLTTIAVYSDADDGAPHTRAADQAVRIGPGPVADSYLKAEAILEAAASTGAEAIHPGYGFLSENAEFARAVTAAGLVFVGPPPDAMEIMGDKARAKRRMIEAGVPCIPGYEDTDQSDARFVDAAARIGFPVMVKAAAGGGGRGMRLVNAAEELMDALAQARSEAQNAFGAGDLILEKAILRPRHVEIQVFADDHGTVLHLGERDCSVQRRHQKVIEEAPCPVMTPDVRAAMGAAAVEAARAVDYRGAGTVEFLLDASGAFYFLEMNTRLQVEHPVTELVTGLDLVALQIAVARGEPLGLSQEDVTLGGHAIEVRLYAEDPAAGFLPSTGPVRRWSPPSGPGVRVDAGIETGGTVSPLYDAMAAKIIAHGPTREAARSHLVRALNGTVLFGPQTNRDFLIDALEQDRFRTGEATTAFIADTYGDEGFAPAPLPDELLAAGAIVLYRMGRAAALDESLGVHPSLLDWTNAGQMETQVHLAGAGIDRLLTVRPEGRDRYRVTGLSDEMEIGIESMDTENAILSTDGRRLAVAIHDDGQHGLFLGSDTHTVHLIDQTTVIGGADELAGGGIVRAPMHGRLLAVQVQVGDGVRRGDRLAVLEAMKMQHEIRADIDGTIQSIGADAGAQLSAGDVILEIAADDDA